MSKSVSAEVYLQQHLALALNGKPTLSTDTTPLDGKRVRHIAGGSEVGTLLGASVVPDFAWVLWDGAEPQHGLHRITDLMEDDNDD